MDSPYRTAENRSGRKFCAKCGRHGEWLVAHKIFDRLEARPCLERVAADGQGQARVPA